MKGVLLYCCIVGLAEMTKELFVRVKTAVEWNVCLFVVCCLLAVCSFVFNGITATDVHTTRRRTVPMDQAFIDKRQGEGRRGC